MDSALGMAILLGIVALLLIGFFMAFWKRDQDRSHEVSEDSGRLDTDTTHRNQDPGH